MPSTTSTAADPSEPSSAASGAQTLDRGLRILELLADNPDGMLVNDLAVALSVHRAVVYRLVNTLTARRMTIRGDDGRVRLWTGVVRLARGVFSELRLAALPELERLAEDLGATATLTVADGDEAVVIAAVEPKNTPIHVAYRPGLRHPLDLGASGKAILAGHPPRPGEAPEITSARRRGYALTQGELQKGAIGLAAPVRIGTAAPDASVGVVSLGALGDADARRVVAAAEHISAVLTEQSA
jgi:DNA-binding IclR family transcriptional regulator